MTSNGLPITLPFAVHVTRRDLACPNVIISSCSSSMPLSTCTLRIRYAQMNALNECPHLTHSQTRIFSQALTGCARSHETVSSSWTQWAQ